MKKALIITNTASMVHLFNELNIEVLLRRKYQIHIACNFVSGNTVTQEEVKKYREKWESQGIICHHIEFCRSPFCLKNIRAYHKTNQLIKKEKFEVISCHTPIIGAFARIAGIKCRKKYGTRIIYTAHGFHFYNGCSPLNWIIYYSVEKLLSYFTDVLITINTEDYMRAIRKFHAKRVLIINGVGVDTRKIFDTPSSYGFMKEKFYLKEEDIIVISVGEVNDNKNHIAVIKALTLCKNKNIHYFIVGIGQRKDKLIHYANIYGVADRVHLLGFRNDIYQLLKSSDIFLFPSLREGLSVALMEAMAAGLPVIASCIRGNVDLIKNEYGGILCPPNDIRAYAEAMDKLSYSKSMRMRFGAYNMEKIKDYDKYDVMKNLISQLSSGNSPENFEEEVTKC